MDQQNFRSSRLLSITIAAAVLGLGGTGRATESPPPAEQHSPARVAPRKQAPPAVPAAADDDAYRCHPSEDIACTIVRETTHGTLIVTMRPAGPSAPTPAWMVISGSPPTVGPHPGGTVYVVPTVTFEPPPPGHQVALMPANGAPILE